MDKANAPGLWDNNKSDMVVEADNVDARATFYSLVDEGVVVLPDTNRHHLFRHEGFDNLLRRLLCESDTLNAKSGIAKDRGDKISTGYLS